MKNQIRAPKARKINSYMIKSLEDNTESIEEISLAEFPTPFEKRNSENNVTFNRLADKDDFCLQSVESEICEHVNKQYVINEITHIVSQPTCNSESTPSIERCENPFTKNFDGPCESGFQFKRNKCSSSSFSNDIHIRSVSEVCFRENFYFNIDSSYKIYDVVSKRRDPLKYSKSNVSMFVSDYKHKVYFNKNESVNSLFNVVSAESEMKLDDSSYYEEEEPEIGEIKEEDNSEDGYYDSDKASENNLDLTIQMKDNSSFLLPRTQLNSKNGSNLYTTSFTKRKRIHSTIIGDEVKKEKSNLNIYSRINNRNKEEKDSKNVVYNTHIFNNNTINSLNNKDKHYLNAGIEERKTKRLKLHRNNTKSNNPTNISIEFYFQEDSNNTSIFITPCKKKQCKNRSFMISNCSSTADLHKSYIQKNRLLSKANNLLTKSSSKKKNQRTPILNKKEPGIVIEDKLNNTILACIFSNSFCEYKSSTFNPLINYKNCLNSITNSKENLSIINCAH